MKSVPKRCSVFLNSCFFQVNPACTTKISVCKNRVKRRWTSINRTNFGWNPATYWTWNITNPFWWSRRRATVDQIQPDKNTTGWCLILYIPVPHSTVQSDGEFPITFGFEKQLYMYDCNKSLYRVVTLLMTG